MKRQRLFPPAASSPESISTGPSPSEKVERSADVLGAVRRTVLTPGLDALRTGVIQLFDLKGKIEQNQAECDQLIEAVETLTEGIVDGTAEGQIPDAAQLTRLRGIVADIHAYLSKLKDDRDYVKIGHAAESSENIKILRRRLENASVRYQTDLLRLHTGMISSVQAKLGGPSSSDPSTGSANPMPPCVPANPNPSKPFIVFGQQEPLETIIRALVMSHSTHVAILGPGGGGKTTLALTALHHPEVVEKYSNRRTFLPCDGIESADGILAALAALFRLTPPDGVSIQQIVVTHLQRCDDAMLLVLDNLESAWGTADRNHVESMLTSLCNVNNLSLIITMRGTRKPRGQDWIQLEPLSSLQPEDTRALFLKISQRTTDVDDPNLDQLLERLDGLPLAVTLIASIGQIGLGPTDLLEAYEREKTAMLKDADGDDRSTSFDFSLNVSLHSRSMQQSSEAFELLQLLSLLPTGMHDGDLVLAFPTMKRPSEAVRVLLETALCTRSGKVSRILAPLREYMLQYHPPSGVHLEELRRFYCDLLFGSPKAQIEIQSDLRHKVETDLHNTLSVLQHAVRAAADGEKILDAIDMLSVFAALTGIVDCRSLLKEAISTYSRIPNQSSHILHGLGRCQASLAQILLRQGHIEHATAAFEAGKAMFHQLGDQPGVALCLWNLGDIKSLQGDFDSAMDTLEETKAIFQQVGDRLGEAHCMWSLAAIQSRQGDYGSAIFTLEEARTIFQQLGDRLGIAVYMWTLGEIQRMLVDYDGATASLQEAKTMFEQLGNRLQVARSLLSLGDIQRMQGEFDSATGSLEEAKTVFQVLGDQLGVAHCMWNLGEIQRMQGHDLNATVTIEAAKPVFQRLGDPLRWGQCFRSLGEIQRKQGDYNTAISSLNTAKKAFQQHGTQLQVAQCMQSLGEIQRIQGDYTSATTSLQEAKMVFLQMGRRLGAAHCTASLAEVMMQQQDHEGARFAYEDAKTVFEQLDYELGVSQCKRRLADIHTGEVRGPQ